MRIEWEQTTLGEVLTLQRGFDLPTQDRKPGHVPIVSSSGISGYNSEARVNAPGVVTGRYGTIGQVFFITEPYWPLNTTLYVKDFKGNDPRFISYFLSTIDFFAHNDKSSVPGVNRNHLHAAAVLFPFDIGEQRAIASVLGALDDKIELNRRMNETLESIARAIFKSWFVDFDPVRAKAEGRQPARMSADSAAMFSGRLVRLQTRESPVGWNIRPFADVCSRIAMGPFGSDIKTDNFVESGVPVIRGGNLVDGFVDDKFVYISEEKADELRNANAFPGDIVITHRGTLGQVGLIPPFSRFRRYVVSQSQLLVSPNEQLASSHFLYCYLRSDLGQHELLANTSQTGVPAIARPVTSLKAIPLLCPPREVVGLFESTVAPLFGRMTANRAESHTLTQIRDTLLPKLLSGQIRVKDAERVVEAAV